MGIENGLPLYIQIAETLAQRISIGEYLPGEVLPAETKLAEHFGVSNITIRKALGILSTKKLISRKRGIGTRVLRGAEDRLAIKITGNFRDWFDSASGKFPRHLDVRILEMGVAHCPPMVGKILSLPGGSKVWHVKRVRKYKGEAYSYYFNYGRQEHFKKITKSMLQKSTLVELLRSCCGFRIIKIDQKVQAVSANMDLCSALNIEFGAPLFRCENIYYDRDLGAVQFTIIYYRGDRYVYSATITDDEGQ